MKKLIYLIPIFLGLVITSCYKDEIDAVGYLPPTSTLSLSDKGTANSYIVSQKGSYKFNAVKGNSSEPVGVVASAESDYGYRSICVNLRGGYIAI